MRVLLRHVACFLGLGTVAGASIVHAEPFFVTLNEPGKQTHVVGLDDDEDNLVSVDIQPGFYEFLINGDLHIVPIASGLNEVRLQVVGGQQEDEIDVYGVQLTAWNTRGFVAPEKFNSEFYLQDGDDTFENHTPNTTYVDAGEGEDVCMGGPGTDLFDGGPGDDFLGGNDGTDFLVGNAGLDFLDGGGGMDFLYGYRIFDTNYSEPDGEIDMMLGGAGPDRFYYRHVKWIKLNIGLPYPIAMKAIQETENVLDYNPGEGDLKLEILTQ